MNMTVTFDSSAWIEYFAGSKKGKKIKKYIEKGENIFTPSICLMEIKNKYQREGYPYQEQIYLICNISSIIEISKEIELEADEIKNKKKI